MVGLTLSLAGVALVMDSLAKFEPQKRSTSAGADAVNSGAYSMYWLTRELQQAGYGIVTTPSVAPAGQLGKAGTPTLLGCRTRFYFNDGNTSANSAVRMAPALIDDGVDGYPDRITVVYGSADALTTPVSLTAAVTSNTAPLAAANNMGFYLGDVVAVVDMDPVKHAALVNAGGTPQCILAQLSGPSALAFKGAPIDPIGGLGRAYSRVFPFNVPTGFSGYSAQTQLVNLGQTPAAVRYEIERTGEQSRLVARDLLRNPNVATVIADGVIDLQAQYGIDNDQDDTVDEWVEPSGNRWGAVFASPLDISRIKALRIGLLVRSGQSEKPSTAGGTCDASSAGFLNEPLLPAESGTVSKPASAVPTVRTDESDWRCFRYKTFRATVPIRNMIWSNL